jgi:hypothetical protein
MRGSRIINGRTKVMALIASGAVAIGACGGSSPRTVSVPAPQQQPAPGYDSPQAAATGYMTGYRKADDKMICKYVVPRQAGLCDFLVGGAVYSLTPFRIGNSMVRGKEAIVVVVADKWCGGKACVHNQDPTKGLPRQAQGFEHAFDATSNALPAVAVVQVDGKWYVALE